MSREIQKRKNKKGAALLLFVILFMAVSLGMTLTIGKVVYEEFVTYKLLSRGKEGYYAVQGALDDAAYRYRNGLDYSSNESFSIGGIPIETEVTIGVVTDETVITAEADNASSIRKGEITLVIGEGVSFGFGLHSGNGGIQMLNTSGVVGNVFSNGQVIGSSNTQNNVYGSVISASASGRIESLHATGTARAHTIEDATIDEAAYYQTISSTFVGGILCPNPNCFPGSDDKAPRAFPISDSEIDAWKTEIENTGTIIPNTDPLCQGGTDSATYVVNTDTTIDNLKVECNMQIKNTTATFEGPLWVVGNLDFDTGPTIVASSSLGQGELPIIVDTEDGSDPYDTGLVTVNSGATFESATTTSFIFLIAMNRSAEEGGTEKAIDLGQTSTGRFVAYAPHGLIEICQSTSLKAVTAYQIKLFNSAMVEYEDGLSDSTFEGVGGGYSIVSWLEI
jgi:hypothetical protein